MRSSRTHNNGCANEATTSLTLGPSIMLRKLAAYRRQNQLDSALQELGRIERTLFMLDWLASPELHRRCHAGLNKSEQRHFLAQVICTFKQGRIADHSAEAHQFRASGLNLVITAIVFWNSAYIAGAMAHLCATEQPVPDARLAHTSPLSWAISSGPCWHACPISWGRCNGHNVRDLRPGFADGGPHRDSPTTRHGPGSTLRRHSRQTARRRWVIVWEV